MSAEVILTGIEQKGPNLRPLGNLNPSNLEDSWQIPHEFLTLRTHPFARDPSPQGMLTAEGCSAVRRASGMHKVIDRVLGFDLTQRVCQRAVGHFMEEYEGRGCFVGVRALYLWFFAVVQEQWALLLAIVPSPGELQHVTCEFGFCRVGYSNFTSIFVLVRYPHLLADSLASSATSSSQAYIP